MRFLYSSVLTRLINYCIILFISLKSLVNYSTDESYYFPISGFSCSKDMREGTLAGILFISNSCGCYSGTTFVSIFKSVFLGLPRLFGTVGTFATCAREATEVTLFMISCAKELTTAGGFGSITGSLGSTDLGLS